LSWNVWWLSSCFLPTLPEADPKGTSEHQPFTVLWDFIPEHLGWTISLLLLSFPHFSAVPLS
jgi:hypothetical protein